MQDALCPPKEKEVFTKILAHALLCSDGAEPPGGPAKSPTNHLSLSVASYEAGSALSMSMLDSHADSGKRTPKGLVKLGSASQGSASRAEAADAHDSRKLLEEAETLQVCSPSLPRETLLRMRCTEDRGAAARVHSCWRDTGRSAEQVQRPVEDLVGRGSQSAGPGGQAARLAHRAPWPARGQQEERRATFGEQEMCARKRRGGAERARDNPPRPRPRGRSFSAADAGDG